MTLTNGESTPTTPSIPQPALSVATTLSSPATPTPNSVFQLKTPTTQITLPDPPPDSDSTAATLPASALTNPNRESLTSSRPAPPSPAPSRRTSAALSRHSSTVRSNRQSKASLLQTAHESEASSSSTATATAPLAAQPKRRSLLFKIRDFAYDLADDRHFGRGPDVPRANRLRQRWSTSSTASSTSSSRADGDEDNDDTGEDARGSWGAYRWNTLSTHFSWAAGEGPNPGEGPSKTDFERNFDVSSPTDEAGASHAGEVYEDAYEGEEEGDDDDGDRPLVPGLYRALYAFDPEGTAEMALEEEQIVHVVGRGGGVGWAIVEKEGGGQALVPESYLELMEAD